MPQSQCLLRLLRPALLLAAALTAAPALRADEPLAPDGEVDLAAAKAQLDAETREIAERLEQSLPAGSEARAMYEAILSGGPMGPETGWWRIAKAQSRFDWPAIRERYDADGDGVVSGTEFPGPADDFGRLDYNEDGLLAKADLEELRQPLEPTVGLQLFNEADADANGKVTRAEFATLFDRWDAGEHGFLALDDVRDRFAAAEPRERGPNRRGPSVATLLGGLARQEIGSLESGPEVGETAPDFTLTAIRGDRQITLSEVVGEKPVVLIFGNFTCGPFRSQAGNLKKLHARYGDRAEFLMVYVREAHPEDGWASTRNADHGIRITQPTSDAERREVAARCAAHLDLPIPLLVDHVDDRVGARYSGMPNRLYLIDREGRIAFKNGRGPFGFKPRELEQALLLLLNEPAPPPATTLSER